MELANDLMTSLRSRVQPAANPTESLRFDWLGLHARLSAAHAARQVLSVTDSPNAVLGGGFTEWSHGNVSGENPSRRVNLTNSTDGKGPCGIAVDAAGHPTPGG